MLPTAEESQAQLLRRIAVQDREALAEFYDQTAGALFSIALRIIGDSQEAEEIIQDVFVQIWEKAATFDPLIGVPFYWAIRITRNRAIDRLRARQRRSRLIDELESLKEVESTVAIRPQSAMLTEQESGAVRSAVNELPAEQRKAIEMAFFRGMTHSEIAEALKEPPGTIKARIRRGMLKLKDSL